MIPTQDAGTEVNSRLLTLVFTDLSNSVGLKTRLGDTEAGRIISSHLDGMRELCEATNGREILVAGDGCFLTFETPSKAVEFALRLQDFHRRNPKLPPVRTGIHMGEVTEKISSTAKGRVVEVDGLAVDIASRIQALAHPSQILMSYSVFDNARQRIDNGALSLPVEWRAHGRYVFAGTDTGLEIYEAGLKSVAQFIPPLGSTKAQRDVSTEDEGTLGWRPAQGLELPGRHNWVLIEKLGEGGFGDVWLAEHCKTRERHVIKFCYSADRLRTLKREVTLFRLLKETLGDRTDIARVLDYQFETTPYYLEMEFAGRHNLLTWMHEKGGVEAIPLDLRLELVAQVADAIAAAHSVGVLHKDIKPSNIMVTESSSQPRVRMIDFGIGAVADRNLLDDKGITATGLTEAEGIPNHASSLTGTRLYMAPELIEGKTATIKSDIYSLGVLLYQMASGKIGQALSFGWERDIPDEALREDIKACVDGRPENRLASAEELAKCIRHLPQRRAKKLEQRQKVERQRRAKKVRRYAYLAGALLLVSFVIVGQYARMQLQRAESEETLRKKAEAAQRDAQLQERETSQALDDARRAQYFGAIALAEASLRESRFIKAQEVLLDEAPRENLQREWGWLLAQTAPEDFALKQFDIFDAVFSPDGSKIIAGDRDGQGHGYVTAYDVNSAKPTLALKTNIRLVWNLAISPDGRYAATASSDQVISIVDLESSSIVHQLREPDGIVRDVAFSPDGKWLAACSRDHSIRIWDTANFQQKTVINVPDDSFTEIHISPDSRYLVSGSLETHVRVFDILTGQQVCQLAEHSDRVLSVVFLADNSAIVTACKDGETRIFDWPLREGVNILHPAIAVRTNNSYPAQVLSSPDGSSVYIGNDNGLVMKVDADTGLELSNIQVDQPLWKVAISNDGKRMLTTSRWSTRMLDLERLEANAEIFDLTDETTVPEGAVNIEIAAVANLRDQTWNADVAWRTTSGISLVTLPHEKQYTVSSAYDIYSPDRSQHLKIDPVTYTAIVTSTETNEVLWDGSGQQITTARFSPDGSQATLLDEKRGGLIFDTESWELLHNIGVGKNAPVSLVYTPDGSQVIIAFLGGRIESYDTSSGNLAKELYTRVSGAAVSLDVSHNGQLLAAGLDVDRAMVIDIMTGDQVSTMTGHVRYIHSIKFVPNSSRLATLSRDGTVKLWDVPTGRELVTLFNLQNNVVPLGITFEPNGRHIHIATSDRRVVTTDVFPWNIAAYGREDYPLDEKIELWKRRQRLSGNVDMEDVREKVVGPPGLEPGTSRL